MESSTPSAPLRFRGFLGFRGVLTLAALFAIPLHAPAQSSQGLLLRARVEPAQGTYYAGQTIRLVLEFEAHDEEIGSVQVGGLPDPEWAETRQTELSELAGSSDVRNDVTVNIRRFAIDYLLLQPGGHTFRPTATAMLERRIQRGGASLFRSFVQSHQTGARAQPITLRVEPLPALAPDDYCGLVGAFALDASIEPSDASPGDLVNLRWTLRGIGNLADFHPPAALPADGFKVYEPKVTVDTATDTLSVAQVYVPQSLDSTNIPAFSVSVFNPRRGAYETLSAGPFALRLHERVAEDIQDFVPSTPEEDKGDDTLALPQDVGADSSPVRTLQAPAEGRLAPSAQSLRLRTLPSGTKVTVLEVSGRWQRVDPGDGAAVWIPCL